MKVDDLSVHALLYSVHHDSLRALWIEDEDRREVVLCRTDEFLHEADALREELGRTFEVAIGRMPLLNRFMTTWGRMLVPAEIRAHPPDVLVVVPHALVHDLPLHLVVTDIGGPLGTVCGIAYCSGMTLFQRCASRNPLRRLDLDTWRFEEEAAPRGHRTGRTLRVGGVDVLAAHDDGFERLAAALAASFRDGEVTTVGGQDQEGASWMRPMRLDRRFVLSQFDAHRESLVDRGPDVLCIVAHGDLDLERHQLSGLLLAAPPRGIGLHKVDFTVDGKRVRRTLLPLRVAPPVNTALVTEVLTAAELELSGTSSSELVCLLGCSAGSGRLLQADEPASLAESFLKLGSPSVVAPMWDAHVDATYEWMACFFEAWIQRGKPKALAGRDATAEVSTRYGPERAGVLTLRGDWL
ncbi:CHAT domain-containing protein [Phytohabitans aurantiacus]|uniref:CHAT domain-containing protein n=1 Tax=Phytohabitans aurantiacus TaxID=3016789 RepID=A0ABQ5QWC3_9ACTN|nr:CHAT domain-containing protein [Phytohabitans aurantiacus]GLH98858.1 hypothetical protein Pa4123_41330 [Phytohabitans aurantiacus]